jgi:hypothetical protein
MVSLIEKPFKRNAILKIDVSKVLIVLFLSRTLILVNQENFLVVFFH